MPLRRFADTDNCLITEGGAQWYVSLSFEAADSQAIWTASFEVSQVNEHHG